MTRIRTFVSVAALSLTLSAASPLAVSAQTEKTKPLADETTMEAKKGKRGKPGWTPGVITGIDTSSFTVTYKNPDGKEVKILLKSSAQKAVLDKLKVGDSIKVADDPSGPKIMKAAAGKTAAKTSKES